MKRRLAVTIAVMVVVVAFGVLIGFAMSGSNASGGTVTVGTPLPPVTTLTTTPQTIQVPPVLPTSTTTTVAKPVRPPTQITKIINKTTTHT